MIVTLQLAPDGYFHPARRRVVPSVDPRRCCNLGDTVNRACSLLMSDQDPARYGPEATLDRLLLVYDRRQSVHPADDVVYHQYRCSRELARRMTQSEAQLTTVLDRLLTGDQLDHFHCPALFHELLTGCVTPLVELDRPGRKEAELPLAELKSAASRRLLPHLNQSSSKLWQSFHADCPLYEPAHCRCNTAKCLRAILQLIDDCNHDQLEHGQLDQSIETTLQRLLSDQIGRAHV